METQEPRFGTVAHLIELAIQGERLSERFYRRLAARFANHPEIAQFWTDYAGEEVGHARWLEDLRRRADLTRLAEAADPQALELGQRAAVVGVERMLDSVRTLQDAYEVANELEHSETNAVLEFLIGSFAEDEESLAFLRQQLNEHVGRLLILFPRQYGTGTLRRGIETLPE